jgi:carboxynorspermidine decarboxylase
MLETAEIVDALRQETGIRVLYAVKSMTNIDVMRTLLPFVNGFTVASLFDARLAREIAGREGFISVGTPGFDEREIDEIGDLCNHVVLNSLGHWERFRSRLDGRTRLGLRINPNVSNVRDRRYDPSRQYSKLGVNIDTLTGAIQENPELLTGLDGILFHTNCDANDFAPILKTVWLLVEKLSPVLENIRWINLGGGYLFTDRSDLSPLKMAAKLLQDRFGLTVFIEPGAAFVRRSGNLVGSVLDLIPTDGPTVAVLDTTVNHAPEVFEYQFKPEVAGATEDGGYRYILAGNTCLAGDLFGEYSFPYPLEIGSPIVFPDMGAYTTVKSHTFNGQNLPSLYWITRDGDVRLRRSYYYDDYRSRLDLGRH